MMQRKGTSTHTLQVIAYLAQIMTLIYDHMVLEGDVEQENLDVIITQNMVGYVQHNYDKHITLADIAESGGIGQSKCCQLFASQLGLSPINYLNQYRLDRSAKLLRETSMPIIEVALSTGFSDSSYFAKQFKQWAKVSPSQYRKDYYGTTPSH